MRIEFEAAIYQVIHRVNRRELIVRDDANRTRFPEILDETCSKADWQIHALCLMYPARVEPASVAAAADGSEGALEAHQCQ